MAMIALAALLMVAAPAKASPAVLYELHQMEIAGDCRCRPIAAIGRFSAFTPTTSAKRGFDKERLKKGGADLLMERYDTSFRFVKVRP
jgi:hypothetical protein